MQSLPLWKSVRFKIDYEYLGTLEMRWVDWVTRPVEWSNKNRGPCYHLDWSRIGTGIAKGLLGDGPQDWNWKLDVTNSNLSPFHIGCCCCCCSLCSDSVLLCLHQAMKFNEVDWDWGWWTQVCWQTWGKIFARSHCDDMHADSTRASTASVAPFWPQEYQCRIPLQYLWLQTTCKLPPIPVIVLLAGMEWLLYPILPAHISL